MAFSNSSERSKTGAILATFIFALGIIVGSLVHGTPTLSDVLEFFVAIGLFWVINITHISHIFPKFHRKPEVN